MRQYIFLGLAAAATLAVSVPSYAAEPQELMLHGYNDQDLGTANIEYAKEGVLIRADVKGMSEGWHGFHIHETGDCSGEGFKSAGGHAHGDAQIHGMRATDNPHWGDMPNIYADATGSGHAEAFIKGLTQADLRDEDGSALIVHTKADDYTTQPSGDAGDRVACAVIAPPRKETP